MAKGTKSGAGGGSKPAKGDDAPKAEPTSYDRVHVWQIQAVRDLLLVAAVVGIVWVGYALRAVTVPLLVALLLAYLFEPLIERLCKHPKIRRPSAVGGLLVTVVLVLLVLVAPAVPLVIGQTTQFIGEYNKGEFYTRLEKISEYVPEAYKDEYEWSLGIFPKPDSKTQPSGDPKKGEQDGGTAQEDEEAPPRGEAAEAASARTPAPVTEDQVRALIREELAGQGEDDSTSSGLLRFAGGSIDAILSVLGTVVQIGLVAFLIPFYFFFFSLWYADVVEFGHGLIPQKNRPRIIELLDRMDRVIAGFVRGRIVISLIMGVMLAIGWMICGVPYSIPLGLVVGVFCAVPYLGAIGIPLAVGLLFVERLGAADRSDLWWLWALLWPTVVFAIVQLIEGYVLTPKIAGKATNLDPVTIIVAVLAGGSVLGIYGMLLAIPLTACGKILITDVLLPSVHAWTRGESADPLPFDRQ